MLPLRLPESKIGFLLHFKAKSYCLPKLLMRCNRDAQMFVAGMTKHNAGHTEETSVYKKYQCMYIIHFLKGKSQFCTVKIRE